jgi:hypothetical protein
MQGAQAAAFLHAHLHRAGLCGELPSSRCIMGRIMGRMRAIMHACLQVSRTTCVLRAVGHHHGVSAAQHLPPGHQLHLVQHLDP